MKKLFENIEGNRFKLLTENQQVNESLVASGLKKVFMNAGNAISYNHIESVGMGYIKDITTAKRVALQEARELAEEFGYRDNEEDARFIKDSPNARPLKKEDSETDMNNSEEKREVQIGKEIIKNGHQIINQGYDQHLMSAILGLAQELIKMHTTQKKPYAGTPFLGGGHGGL